VRYTSPKRGSPAADSRAGHASPPVQSPQAQSPAAPRQAGGALVIEPEHLASLTPEQRQDLRLWHGRVNLIDRVKAMRGYFWVTLGMWALGMAGFAFGVDEAPPLVLSPIVPIYMTVKAWQRGKSLRERGLKLRRVLLMPRLKWVIPTPPPPLTEHQLEKLAPREVLDSPEGAAIRRAAADRAAVLDMLAKLSKQDRAFLPDVEPTVKVLVERVVQLAEMLHRLNQSIDWRLIDELDARIGEVQRQSASVEGQRQLALLQRQRATLEDLVKRRTELVRQLDSAGLAIGNLRLDLVKFQSSGLQSALSDVSNATQEARALSRDIDALLDAAAEMKSL
jgi:hypothetical protein